MPKLPDWWEPHLAYLKSSPAADGLRAVARAVAPGSGVVRVRRLGGGIGTVTSAIRLRTRSGRNVDVVLKRYPAAGEPRNEWRKLVFAQRLPVPTPEPLALDARGVWFGTPALVMQQLPGHPDVRPRRLDAWLNEIVRAQILIHSANTRVPAAIRRPLFPDGWKPPTDIRRTPLVTEVIAKLRRRVDRVLERDVVVTHGDWHPGNLLWSRGRISGIIDWSSARLAPRAEDVAYMRADIAVLLGPRAADKYGEAYERNLGRHVDHLAVWDLVCALNALHWSVLWVHPYREQGAELTHERARRHVSAWLRRSLARV